MKNLPLIHKLINLNKSRKPLKKLTFILGIAQHDSSHLLSEFQLLKEVEIEIFSFV